MKNWETVIMEILSKVPSGKSATALAAAASVKRKERAAFLLLLRKMERDRWIVRGKKGIYRLSKAAQAKGISATLLSLSRGFGFARGEEDGVEYFIPGRFLSTALPGDRVLLHPEAPEERGPVARVLRVLETGSHEYNGQLRTDEHGRLVIWPDGELRQELPLKASALSEGEAGQKVRFSVKWERDHLVASILLIYGNADSARVCSDALIDQYGIPVAFSPETLAQAEAMRQVGITKRDWLGRTDLREHFIFTIDGADAKDLDDAVSLEETESGWTLGVHIADVSHYVGMGTALDQDARQRGTSIYFADRVIPMLPEALSNDLCSLNPGGDKLTLTVQLQYDREFRLTGSRLLRTVICSKLRGVYDEINDLFSDTADNATREKYREALPVLQQLRMLTTHLEEQANARGSLRLPGVEAQFRLDEQGRAAAVFPRITGEAEHMIEQCMIAANVAIAAMAREKKVPFVYRIHEHPSVEKLTMLAETVQALGLKATLHPENSTPQELNALLTAAQETPYAELVANQLLRSMAKAKYSVVPVGHYGLALSDYCHFTSPIRRYPDLAIHRILTAMLTRTPKKTLYERYETFAAQAAEQSTACEIRAMTAERDCEACYKAEYMARFLGQTFSGVISGVSAFGFYVTLPNTIEGMVRLESLAETELEFDGVASLRNTAGHPVYTVGQRMEVQVASCNVATGRIAFLIAGSSAEKEK